MSDAVLVALITAISTVICQLLINRSNRKKRLVEDAEKEKNQAVKAAVAQKELETRLSNIEGKLDIHNGYAEKLGAIEKSIAVIETEIKNIYKDEKK